MDAHKKRKISIKKLSYIKAATGNLSKTMLNFNKPNLQIKIKQEVKHIITSSTTFAEF